MSTGRTARAINVFRKGLQEDPSHVLMNNNLAWLLATSPSAELRNGAEALRRARIALEVTEAQDPGICDTMAAAYAELGQFDEACRQAQTGMKLAKEAGLTDLAREVSRRLELYRSGRPYREP